METTLWINEKNKHYIFQTLFSIYLFLFINIPWLYMSLLKHFFFWKPAYACCISKSDRMIKNAQFSKIDCNAINFAKLSLLSIPTVFKGCVAVPVGSSCGRKQCSGNEDCYINEVCSCESRACGGRTCILKCK